MDFQMYDCPNNNQTLVQEFNPTADKTNWNIVAESYSMDNEELFDWTNGIKLDESHFKNIASVPRKRKLERNTTSEGSKIKTALKALKSNEDNGNHDKQQVAKKSSTQSGSSKMPQWQVDDISELNDDIEGSFNGLGSELSNNSYNMSDAILSIPGLTVFKQEAPSPPIAHDVNASQMARQNHNIPVTTQSTVITPSNSISDSNAMINTTLHQLLGQAGYSSGLQNPIDSNLIPSPPSLSQDGFGVVSSASMSAEDCRFQYVLAAATSIATKLNEDTLTYLNQGQSYEIKLKKLGDLSTYRGKLLKSVIKICFHERRLQYMEKEQMRLWQSSRPGDKILEVDVPLSYGLCNIIQSALNTVHFNWDPTKEVGVYIKVNCISTEFTPKKHGGEKGVPFRIQVETYQAGDGTDTPNRLHAAVCQIKVFKLKGADRKHKQDRDKIMKRPSAEQEKYQPSYDCTVLTDVPCDSVALSPPTTAYNSECGSPGKSYALQNDVSPKYENNPTLSPASPTISGNIVTTVSEKRTISEDAKKLSQPLADVSNPEQTVCWLTANRFDKYIETFSSFSGADMLRMSREDFIQICGQADGIRLYNAIHLKAIAPKLTIYVSRESSNIFNAIFLSTHNNVELVQKLSSLACINQDQVRDVYIQGPQSIHILLSNDVVGRIKDESMFTLDVLQDNGSYVLLLKPTAK